MYAIIVEIILRLKISLAKLLISFLLHLYFDPSRTAYLSIPNTANSKKYVTIELEKLYLPISSTASTREIYGNVINGNIRFKTVLIPFNKALNLIDLLFIKFLSLFRYYMAQLIIILTSTPIRYYQVRAFLCLISIMYFSNAYHLCFISINLNFADILLKSLSLYIFVT